ncbi:hypothetical protein GUJ93_ZPchr0010g7435 [Zizania palustris]|uniref:Uncharacterized protein n=1 Tax=Zizania palustris TaxID=103762 RepID=A0A8J5WAS6_ZIZPA|nr:hypothetical protein GUJ93_ZPchr0010g7435 [Zizania palustris]
MHADVDRDGVAVLVVLGVRFDHGIVDVEVGVAHLGEHPLGVGGAAGPWARDLGSCSGRGTAARREKASQPRRRAMTASSRCRAAKDNAGGMATLADKVFDDRLSLWDFNEIVVTTFTYHEK